MLKVASLIWIMLGTVLAGIAVLVITATPALFDRGFQLVPYGAIGGFLLAVPFAILIARRIGAK